MRDPQAPEGATHYTEGQGQCVYWRKSGPSPNLRMMMLDRWENGAWVLQTGYLPWTELLSLEEPGPDLVLDCKATKGQCCFDATIAAYDRGEFSTEGASITCTCGTKFVRRGLEIVADA